MFTRTGQYDDRDSNPIPLESRPRVFPNLLLFSISMNSSCGKLMQQGSYSSMDDEFLVISLYVQSPEVIVSGSDIRRNNSFSL
jgi:hypothetical protein